MSWWMIRPPLRRLAPSTAVAPPRFLLPEAALPTPPILAAIATIPAQPRSPLWKRRTQRCAGCRTCVLSFQSFRSPGATCVWLPPLPRWRLPVQPIKVRLRIASSNGLSIAVRRANGETGGQSTVPSDSAPPPSPAPASSCAEQETRRGRTRRRGVVTLVPLPFRPHLSRGASRDIVGHARAQYGESQRYR